MLIFLCKYPDFEKKNWNCFSNRFILKNKNKIGDGTFSCIKHPCANCGDKNLYKFLDIKIR